MVVTVAVLRMLDGTELYCLQYKRALRVTPLGQDRDFNTYWFVLSDPSRVYVQLQKQGGCGYYSTTAEIEQLIQSLHPDGRREGALREALQRYAPGSLQVRLSVCVLAR